MKVLPLLLAVLLAWLAVAGGYHLVDVPHFWGGGDTVPLPWIICFPPAFPELNHFAIAVVFLGGPGLLLLAGLALWGRWQRRAGRCAGDNRDLWLTG